MGGPPMHVPMPIFLHCLVLEHVANYARYSEIYQPRRTIAAALRSADSSHAASCVYVLVGCIYRYGQHVS